MWLRQAITLSISFLGCFSGLVYSQQVPLTESISVLVTNRVIDEDLYSCVNQFMSNKSIKGLSMAVVRPDGEVEYGSWGIRTEEGDKVTPEVRST